MGGLAGLAGILPTIWSVLLRWDKRTKRGIFQSYNLVITALSLAVLYISGYLTPEFWALAMVYVPFSMASAWVGIFIFQRLGERQFDSVILAILAGSSLSILVSLLL